MVKQVLRKADKPRTALKALKKEAQGLSNRQRKMAANPKELHVIENAVIDRKLSNNKKKQEAVQKVINSRTKVNNKDLSKSLGSVASNKGMKKSNLQGTYNEQKRRAYNHYIESQTDYDGNGGVSTYNMTEYLKAKKAQKQMKSINKTAKKQGVKLKK